MTAQPIEEKSKPDPRALNAYRHGLTGQVHIGTEAEQEAYDIHCKNIHEALAPVGAMEIEIAQDIADDRWSLKRGRAIESTGYAIGVALENEHFSPNNHPEAYNPINDFPRQTQPLQFVFSNEEIAALATHLRRLDQAKTHRKARQNFARKAA